MAAAQEELGEGLPPYIGGPVTQAMAARTRLLFTATQDSRLPGLTALVEQAGQVSDAIPTLFVFMFDMVSNNHNKPTVNT